jgi:hypothetical protein
MHLLKMLRIIFFRFIFQSERPKTQANQNLALKHKKLTQGELFIAEGTNQGVSHILVNKPCTYKVRAAQ